MTKEDKGYLTRVINKYSNIYLSTKIFRSIKSSMSVYLSSKEKDKDVEVPAIEGYSPVIILGMHRSGTTLISKLIRASGIQMGKLRGGDTDESLFFQNLNNGIFRLCKASWDEPLVLQEKLSDDIILNAITKTMIDECTSKRTSMYFKRKDRSRKSMFSINFRWGWKDPRTVYTLPIWLKLFPDAKIVYIHRNGIDVANSLFLRNKIMLNLKYFSLRCLRLEGAFKLWEMYNNRCLELINKLPERQVWQLKYEDLLMEPRKHLLPLFQFLEHGTSEELMEELCKKVRSDRAYAFMNNEELNVLYKLKKDSPLMSKLGYSNIS